MFRKDIEKIRKHENTFHYGVCCCMSKTILPHYKGRMFGVTNSKKACGARYRRERKRC